MIQAESFCPLLIEPMREGQDEALGKATGFVVASECGPMLLTNWHVVTGKHFFTKRARGYEPTHLRIRQIGPRVGEWTDVVEPLFFDDGVPRWVELERNCGDEDRIDVVALPVTQREGVVLRPLDLEAARPIVVAPGGIIHVVGYPFGESSGGKLPIWLTGFTACELASNYNDRAAFLIDCRTRPGCSGSPVFAGRSATGYELADGSTADWLSAESRFLGVYSSRLSTGVDGEETDLGWVWKRDAIRSLLMWATWKYRRTREGLDGFMLPDDAKPESDIARRRPPKS